MPYSYSSCLIHYVWSTKERRNLISANLQPRLWAYLGGIANQNEMKALAVGGTDNHVHLLVSFWLAMPRVQERRQGSLRSALLLRRIAARRSAAPQGLCPVGANENSPAIYRWVQGRFGNQ